jgi:HrpA-like RNA helicase
LSKDLGVFLFLLSLVQEFSNMVYTAQRRERLVSVFDVAALLAVRAARFFREASRRSKRERAEDAAKRPQKDARKRFGTNASVLTAQAPPRASEVRMRDDVEALRVQRLL